MKIISLGFLVTLHLFTAVVAEGAEQNKTQGAPAILSDGKDAKSVRFEDTGMVRFIEIFSTAADPKTGELVAACHNSLFNSKGVPKNRDTAPSAMVKGIDFDKLKKEFGVLNVSLNGPKIWIPNWTEVTIGEERNFNGIQAPWIAQLNIGNKGNVAETTPYVPKTIFRKSALGWKKGTKALLIDDADGNTWIMKGFHLGLNPKHTYEQFAAAGEKNFKKLPKGWRFRIKVLEKDLTETPENGIATIMADEFFHVYDKTGPGMSDYKP